MHIKGRLVISLVCTRLVRIAIVALLCSVLCLRYSLLSRSAIHRSVGPSFGSFK